jgi:hypothetical protein
LETVGTTQRITMYLNWQQIVFALAQLGAESAVVRPGLYGRVMKRLRDEEPPSALQGAPNDRDADDDDGLNTAGTRGRDPDRQASE